MTAPQPPSADPWGVEENRVATRRLLLLSHLERDYGLVIGQPVDVELMVRTHDRPTIVAGTLLEVTDTDPGGPTLVVGPGSASSVRSTVPWHAVARIITRPAHPAL